MQSALGLLNFILHIHDRHYFYHGAIITEWKDRSSVSLGTFVFVTIEPYFYSKLKNEYTMEELSQRLLVREGVSYFSFYTEKWANHLGEKMTGQKSMENLVID